MPFTQEQIDEEQAHFSNVIQTFRNYAQYSVSVSSESSPLCHISKCRLIPSLYDVQLSANNRRRKDYYTLPRADQELLDGLGYKEKLAEADRAILANAEFLNQIVANPEIFGHEVDEEDLEGEQAVANAESHAQGITYLSYTMDIADGI